MGYVKTPEEIDRIRAALRNPRFTNGHKLTVDFLTDEATFARLLPPGFTPVGDPIVTAMIGRWQSNCVGDFQGGALYMAARFAGVDGGYALAMWMDTDRSTIFGRDLYGEPKKMARVGLERTGDHVAGFIERDGVRLIEAEAELSTEHPPRTVERRALNIKARPAAGADGLQEDAIVTCALNVESRELHLEGSGSVRLTGTAHDPVDELEVLSVVRATYVVSDASATIEPIGTIPGPDFEPWFYGRSGDDWSALVTEGSPAVWA